MEDLQQAITDLLEDGYTIDQIKAVIEILQHKSKEDGES